MTWSAYSPRLIGLPLAQVQEQGLLFKTGVPVRFQYVRETSKAPYLGEKFQQHIEPAGLYVIHNEDPGDLPRTWVSDVVQLQNPLVLQLNTMYPDEIYGPHSWKAALYRHFGVGGRALSDKLRALGFDGVVTVDDVSTREIVLL